MELQTKNKRRYVVGYEEWGHLRCVNDGLVIYFISLPDNNSKSMLAIVAGRPSISQSPGPRQSSAPTAADDDLISHSKIRRIGKDARSSLNVRKSR